LLVGAVKFYRRVLISLNKASDLKLKNGAFKECGRYALPMISVVSIYDCKWLFHEKVVGSSPTLAVYGQVPQSEEDRS